MWIMWIGGRVVRTSDSRLAVECSPSGHDTACLFRWPSLGGKLSWELQPPPVSTQSCMPGVAKSSTIFGWDRGGKVTAAVVLGGIGNTMWSHMACDSRSCVVKFTNCYTLITLLYFTLCWADWTTVSVSVIS